jgi:hypothetical protein
MCRSYYRVLNPCQMLIRSFVSYELLQNIKRSQQRKKLEELTGTHMFVADGYVRMGQRVVNPHIFFQYHIYNDMLLIATYRKL